MLKNLEREPVALVGHEPDLSGWAAWVIGSKKAQLALAKAGVAHITCENGPAKGAEMAFFNFAFRSTNQSNGPVLTTFQFGPEPSQSIYLDSAKFTFTSDSPLSWPDIGVRVSTNGFTPTQISRVDNQQTVILSYQNMGFYGQGTELFDLWFGITIVTGTTNTNHSVFLTVNLTGHNPHALLIGQSYTAEAVFQIVAHPNGLLTVSDTAF